MWAILLPLSCSALLAPPRCCPAVHYWYSLRDGTTAPVLCLMWSYLFSKGNESGIAIALCTPFKTNSNSRRMEEPKQNWWMEGTGEAEERMAFFQLFCVLLGVSWVSVAVEDTLKHLAVCFCVPSSDACTKPCCILNTSKQSIALTLAKGCLPGEIGQLRSQQRQMWFNGACCNINITAVSPPSFRMLTWGGNNQNEESVFKQYSRI